MLNSPFLVLPVPGLLRMNSRPVHCFQVRNYPIPAGSHRIQVRNYLVPGRSYLIRVHNYPIRVHNCLMLVRNRLAQLWARMLWVWASMWVVPLPRMLLPWLPLFWFTCLRTTRGL